jgi:hypothetical protein
VSEKATEDGHQRTANSEATLGPLYRNFWKQNHDVKQYFLPSEDFTREFADYFFTSGLDVLTLDQLLELSDIYFPMDTTSMSISFVSDLHTTSAVPLSRDLQYSIAKRLTDLQSGSNKLMCCLCGRSHSRKGRLEGCINRHFGEKPYVCDGKCGTDEW